ncbi:MAG: hypothetical protein ABIV93_08520 [Byssovorax sp.]
MYAPLLWIILGIPSKTAANRVANGSFANVEDVKARGEDEIDARPTMSAVIISRSASANGDINLRVPMWNEVVRE